MTTIDAAESGHHKSAFLWCPALAGLFLTAGLTASAQSSATLAGRTFARLRRLGRDADGTKHFVFGYMNRNWQEEIDVPVGPENGFNIGGADQGQPTHFLPRRNRFVFRAGAGRVQRHRRTDLDVDNEGQDRARLCEPAARLQARRRGARVGNRRARRRQQQSEIRANKPPKLEVQGRKSLTAKVGEPVMLSAVVTDDGIPKRRASGWPAPRSRIGSRRERRGDDERSQPAAAESRDAAPRPRHRHKERRPARHV